MMMMMMRIKMTKMAGCKVLIFSDYSVYPT